MQANMYIFKMTESLFGWFLVRKRSTKSSMWQNFGLMATEDGMVIEKEQFVEHTVKVSSPKAATPQIISSV